MLVLRFLALVLLLLLAAGGCAVTPPPPPVTAAAHPAEAFEAAGYLPDSTAVFLATPKLSELLEAASYRTIRRAFPEVAERAAFMIARETGLAPLEPASLDEMGVDLDGPAGFALVPAGGRGELHVVGFLRLRSPDRFKAALYRALAMDADLEVVDEAVVLSTGDFSIVLRGHTALIVGGYDREGTVAELVTPTDATSLARHRGFRASLRSVAAESLVGYVDVRGLIYQEAGLDPRWGGDDAGAARTELGERHRAALDGARRAGAEARELVRIDARFREAREGVEDDERHDRLRALVGSVDGLGLAIRLRRAGLDFEATLLTGPSSPWPALLGESGPDALVVAREGEPGLVLGGQLDPAALVALVGRLGGPPEGLLVLGELDELAAALTGAFALTVALPQGGLAALTTAQELDLSLQIGVREPNVVRRAIERFAALPGAPQLERRGEAFALKLGERTVTIAMGDDALSASTRPGAFHVRARGRAEPVGPVWELAARPVRRAFAGAALVGLPFYLRDLGDMTSVEAESPHDPEVPKSPAYEAMKAQLAAVDARLAAVLKSFHADRRRELSARFDGLGAAGLVVRAVPGGLKLSGRWSVTRPSLVEALAGLDAPEAPPKPWDDPAFEPLRQERVRLSRELDELYDDLEASRKTDGAEAPASD